MDAQKLFENLGYVKDKRHGYYDVRYILQTRQTFPYRVVEFYEGTFVCYLECEGRDYTIRTGESTLKAINKQMEELGWI